MANKRMLDKEVINADNFLDMPLSTQALYMHLNINADDDGFVTPRSIMRLCGANQDDLNVLITKRFVIPFESGVVVLTHWHKNNFIRGDRYTASQYIQEYRSLTRLSNKQYELRLTTGQPSDTLDKIRLDKIRLDKIRERGEKKVTKHINTKKYLLEIPKEDIDSLSKYYKANAVQILDKGESLYEYIESKGKVYKNYKALLQGALRRDYGKRY